MAYFVLDAGKRSEFAFYDYAVVVSVFNYFFGEFDVVFKRVAGAVNHNRSKTAVDASFTGLEIGTVVKV